jgi:2,3,4,5-tetrahydropyridine-2,6-dicarboxylate N-succinyltransferase
MTANLLKCLPKLNPSDFEGNVDRICRFLGLSCPASIGNYLKGFTVRESIYDTFSADMESGKFKTGVILMYAAVLAGGGVFKVDQDLIRLAFGEKICSDLGNHASVAALLSYNDPDVYLDIISVEPILCGVYRIIDEGHDIAKTITNETAPQAVRGAIGWIYQLVELGELRVVEKKDGEWIVNEAVKKAFPLSFRIMQNEVVSMGAAKYYDKIPLLHSKHTEEKFKKAGYRAVPGAIVRSGCYIAPDAIIMPSFVNIGAYVGRGTMADSFVTVGSCAYVGEGVHLSSGVVVGGVLEPFNACPVIIEDGCRIGACSSITEGVIVEAGSILASNVHLSRSTKIYDRQKGVFLEYGRIPAGSLVVPGSYRSAIGDCNINCAVIAQKVDEDSLRKFGLNDLLRNIN